MNDHATGELAAARARIDELDRQMARLFAERMNAVSKVAAYKKERGLPVRDPAREAAVLERGAGMLAEELRPYYLRFQQSVMDTSCQYQQDLMDGTQA